MTCNLDVDGCTGGEDGEPCDACVASRDEAAAYYGARWAVASPKERDPARYRAEMIDAGRGHLLGARS